MAAEANYKLSQNLTYLGFHISFLNTFENHVHERREKTKDKIGALTPLYKILSLEKKIKIFNVPEFIFKKRTKSNTQIILCSIKYAIFYKLNSQSVMDQVGMQNHGMGNPNHSQQIQIHIQALPLHKILTVQKQNPTRK